MSSPTSLSDPIALPNGEVTLRNRAALAPMAGMTDVPFRTLAWSYGAGLMVSEMVTSKPELWDTGKSRSRRVLIDGVTPQAVQIAGYDPVVMAESARRLVGEGVELVDINFGCPRKSVVRRARPYLMTSSKFNALSTLWPRRWMYQYHENSHRADVG